MPIVPSFVTLQQERSAITLSMYCIFILHYPEWMFWGVQREGDPNYQCQRYWLKAERDMLARYLWEAQVEVEEEAGFPVGRRWFVDDQRPYSYPLMASRGYVVTAGIEARDTIEAGATVTHNADDANGNPVDSTVTVNTAITDVDEIRIFYPVSLGVEGPVEIDPSDIDISGGVATISIPRWRMVKPEFADAMTHTSGVHYDPDTSFLDTVDVLRVYNDPSTNATLIWPHSCSSLNLCTCNCSDYRRDACIYVRDSKLGVLDVLAARYSGGTWTAQSCACSSAPEIALLNYYAGLDYDGEKFVEAMDAVVRAAHAKMPEEPCGCEVSQRIWARDRNTPDILTRERLDCPFGMSDGAWIAWRFTQAVKTHRMGVSL